jgi:CHASE2 domain-containing sensor protein
VDAVGRGAIMSEDWKKAAAVGLVFTAVISLFMGVFILFVHAEWLAAMAVLFTLVTIISYFYIRIEG